MRMVSQYQQVSLEVAESAKELPKYKTGVMFI